MKDGLQDFMDAVKNDCRIKPSHISLYAALALQGENVPRGMLLQQAKIAESTLHRCLHDLQAFGFILYEPSYNPKKKSKIILLYGDLVCTDGR